MSRTRSEIVHWAHSAEDQVIYWLSGHLPQRVHRASYGDSYDALYGDRLIEIKAANFDGKGWQFSIQRHGALNEDGISAYVLRLQGVPGFKSAIHLIIPAPIKRHKLSISLRSLLTRYAKYFNRFDFIEPSMTTKRSIRKSA